MPAQPLAPSDAARLPLRAPGRGALTFPVRNSPPTPAGDWLTPRPGTALLPGALPTLAEAEHLMAMPHTARRWTADMLRALPDDGNRYEAVDGELFVTPAPTPVHQRAVHRLDTLLTAYVDANRLGEVLEAPADITFGADALVQPDLFVVPGGAAGRLARTWDEIRTLLLVVEVLSPSTARADRQVKRRLYQRQQVPEYWIVDVDGRVVERWRPDDERPEILSETVSWQPDPGRAPLVLNLVEYFGRVLGD